MPRDGGRPATLIARLAPRPYVGLPIHRAEATPDEPRVAVSTS
jgi:hypothetical protein